MFGPNQVGELIVGNAVASQTTVATFVSSALDKQVKVLSKDGTIVTAGKPFHLLQSTSGNAAKGLNFEFSDKIDPRYIDKITLKAYEPEVLKVVKVDGFAVAGTVAVQRTYEIEIRLEDELSPENFTTIPGYYVTGEVIGSDTATTVRDGIIASINKNLARRGNSEFTVAANGTGISVTEKYQENQPGKIDGRKLGFSVVGRVFNNISNGYNSNLGLLTSVILTAGKTGNGTGKFATNYEYFVKGMKYDPANAFNFLTQFAVPFYASKTGVYNTIQIKYYGAINNVITERQYKVLTILIDKGVDTLANNANTNSVLADIRTAVGSLAVVPGNLAVI